MHSSRNESIARFRYLSNKLIRMRRSCCQSHVHFFQRAIRTHNTPPTRLAEITHKNTQARIEFPKIFSHKKTYRRKDDNRRLRVEIAIRAIASEFTIA